MTDSQTCLATIKPFVELLLDSGHIHSIKPDHWAKTYQFTGVSEENIHELIESVKASRETKIPPNGKEWVVDK